MHPGNRPLIGIISIVCLIAGLLIGFQYSIDNIWCGGFIRVGLVMGALWVAAPTKGRAAAWANIDPWWLVGLALLLLFVRRVQILVPFLIVLFVLAVIVPKFLGKRK